MPPNKTWKVLMCGLGATGKSSILEHLINSVDVTNQEEPFHSTIEDIYIAYIEAADKAAGGGQSQAENKATVKEKIRFLDTGSTDEMNPEVAKHYYSSSDGFVFVYDICNLKSFQYLEKIRKDVERNKERKEMPPILVLGNKKDLSESRQVKNETAQNWADNNKVHLREVTAKDRKELIEAFQFLASRLVQSQGKGKKKG